MTENVGDSSEAVVDDDGMMGGEKRRWEQHMRGGEREMI